MVYPENKIGHISNQITHGPTPGFIFVFSLVLLTRNHTAIPQIFVSGHIGLKYLAMTIPTLANPTQAINIKDPKMANGDERYFLVHAVMVSTMGSFIYTVIHHIIKPFTKLKEFACNIDLRTSLKLGLNLELFHRYALSVFQCYMLFFLQNRPNRLLVCEFLFRGSLKMLIVSNSLCLLRHSVSQTKH